MRFIFFFLLIIILTTTPILSGCENNGVSPQSLSEPQLPNSQTSELSPTSPAKSETPPTAPVKKPIEKLGGIIVFSTGRQDSEIYRINDDGTDLLRLTNNQYTDDSPACSPNGNKIAFFSYRDGENGLFIMDIDGSNQRALSTDLSSYLHIGWSPDSTRIAFVAESGPRTNRNIDIYTINIDGTGQTKFTRGYDLDDNPMWSPDGTKVAFTRGVGPSDPTPLGAKKLIYIANADSLNDMLITNQQVFNDYPNWTPDSNSIIFTALIDASTITSRWQICRINKNGSNQVNLSNNNKSDQYLKLSPDGKYIAFLRKDRWNSHDEYLYVMKSDGTNQIELCGPNVSDFCWSPDGTKIAFISPHITDNNGDIFIAEPDGSSKTPLITNITYPKWLSWSEK